MKKLMLILSLALACLLGGIGGAALLSGESPVIALTNVPARGDGSYFTGYVFREDGAPLEGTYRVALFVQTGNAYFPKPTYDHPYADVDEDGFFAVNYATANSDLQIENLHLMVVPGDFLPDTFSNTRAVALDYVKVSRPAGGEVVVTPKREYNPGCDPGVPTGLKPAADKIAVNVGFYTDGSLPGSPLSADLIRAQLSALSRFADTVRFYSASGEVSKAYKIAHDMDLTVLGGAWLTPGDEAANKAELDALIEHCKQGYVRGNCGQ